MLKLSKVEEKLSRLLNHEVNEVFKTPELSHQEYRWFHRSLLSKPRRITLRLFILERVVEEEEKGTVFRFF